jgi:hypothetical protein
MPEGQVPSMSRPVGTSRPGEPDSDAGIPPLGFAGLGIFETASYESLELDRLAPCDFGGARRTPTAGTLSFKRASGCLRERRLSQPRRRDRCGEAFTTSGDSRRFGGFALTLPLPLPPRAPWTSHKQRNLRVCGSFSQADARTRTGDPFITRDELATPPYHEPGEGVESCGIVRSAAALRASVVAALSPRFAYRCDLGAISPIVEHVAGDDPAQMLRVQRTDRLDPARG